MNKSLRLLIAIITMTMATGTSFAQLTGKETKAVKKAEDYYGKGNYEKAIATLQPVLDKHDKDDRLWNTMVDYFWERYTAEKKRENDELMQQIMKSLTSNKKNNVISVTPGHSRQYLSDFIQVCSRATLKSEFQENASIYLRNFLVDDPVDTAVSKEAKSKFDDAEKEFSKQNFSAAISLYKEAAKIDSTYYKAVLYIGDCMWNNRQPENALDYFKKAIAMQPHLLEPRKYLVDAYMSMDHYEMAYNECINALIAHPDVGMFLKLDKICGHLSKKFDRHFMPRDYALNQPGMEQKSIGEEPWKYYREAKDMIKPYCDDKGVIVKANDLTKQKYMETFCWEYMLKHSTDERLAFAKKAMEDNYLDCYVFVSLYHVAINDQYDHFSDNNAERIKSYINKYLVQ